VSSNASFDISTRELYSVSPNEGCVDRDRKRDHENSDPHGLMIIARVDLGGVASLSGHETRCSLYLVGNPLIANQIISIDLRGSFYVPFRVALYDDGAPRAP
jgi:uncharacterized protein (DUF302 family)